MTGPTVRSLDVPGATLHYEVRGSGAVLLLIRGGIHGAEAAAFATRLHEVCSAS